MYVYRYIICTIVIIVWINGRQAAEFSAIGNGNGDGEQNTLYVGLFGSFVKKITKLTETAAELVLK